MEDELTISERAVDSIIRDMRDIASTYLSLSLEEDADGLVRALRSKRLRKRTEVLSQNLDFLASLSEEV